jgi:hypothetical protein
MRFERGRDIKEVLNIGIMEQLPEWMKDSGLDYTNYYEVWIWAIREEKSFIFPLVVQMRGKKWFEETIVIGMADNNALLWESVSQNCFPAVEAIMKIEGLFSKEVLNMQYGTSALNETFMRGDSKRNYRATNLGQFVNLAMLNAKGDFELQDVLTNYYKKYKE